MERCEIGYLMCVTDAYCEILWPLPFWITVFLYVSNDRFRSLERNVIWFENMIRSMLYCTDSKKKLWGYMPEIDSLKKINGFFNFSRAFFTLNYNFDLYFKGIKFLNSFNLPLTNVLWGSFHFLHKCYKICRCGVIHVENSRN